MAYRDLDEFLIRLEQADQLLTITTPVSTELEIAEIVQRIAALPANKNKALLFDNVEGSTFPVLVNLFGTEQRMAWALGVEKLADLSDKLSKLLDPRIPTGMGEMMARAGELLGALRSAGVGANRTRIAPVQEIVMAENPDVRILPALKCYPDEGGRFLPLTQVITQDPQTGARNVGMYRAQILGKDTLALHFPPLSGGVNHLQAAQAANLQKLPVAIVLGGDPAAIFASLVPMPPGIDEYMLAGWLRGKPIEYAKCLSQDIDVPANAEIIIEGYIAVDEVCEEGPFGGDSGYFSLPTPASVMVVTAITHRKNAVFATTVPGQHSQDSKWLHGAVERLLLPILKLYMGEIHDFHYPQEGAFRELAIVSIKKQYEMQAQKVMYGLWGLAPTMLTKVIVVVNDDVNVRDYRAVAERIYETVLWGEDVLTIQGVTAQQNAAHHAPDHKTGIAATRKTYRTYPLRQVPAPLTGDAAEKIQARIGEAWRVWENKLITIALAAGTADIYALLVELAELAPNYSVILLPATVSHDNLADVIRHLLTHWDWSLGHIEYFGGGFRLDATAISSDDHQPLLPDPVMQKHVSQKWLQYGVE